MNRFVEAAFVSMLVVINAGILYGYTRETDGEANPTLLYWQNGVLEARGPTPSDQFSQIVQLINDQQFDQALIEIKQLETSDRFRGELVLAVAGHLENEDPGPALDLATKYLQQAPDNDDIAANRLRHELELYQHIPNQGWRTDPQGLPSRDLIREGKLAEGLANLEK